MGKRGPKPKPKAIRLLEGNPGRLPILPDEVDVTPDLPAVKPEAVAADPVANLEWERIVSAMPRHLYTAADVAVLTLYCQSWSLFWQAQREIDENGLLIEEITEKENADGGFSRSRKLKANPAVAIWKSASENLLKTTDRLGLNPGVRARLAVPNRGENPTQGTKFGDLIAR